MKKVFLFLVLCCTMLTVFGQKQYTDEQIRVGQLVLKNKANNPHIANPNVIWPGQALFFRFEDGFDTLIFVQSGDTQEGILTPLVETHGSVVTPKDSSVAKGGAIEFVHPEPFHWWVDFPFGWLLVILVVLILGIKLLTMVNWQKLHEKRSGKFSSNPVTEGKPFVDGGVRSENAERHFSEILERNNPNSNIRLKDVRPGFLSTVGSQSARVEYSDKTHQNLLFRNVPAYAGMVSLDGGKSFREEYFFEGCGNPVYRRKSLRATNNLLFTTTRINFGDESPVAVDEKSTQETIKQPSTLSKEIDGISEDMSLLAEKIAVNNKIHSVEAKVESFPNGKKTFTFKLNTQYPQPRNRKKTEDKK